MWCPECHTQYRDGFIHCADCDVPLIERPPLIDELWWDKRVLVDGKLLRCHCCGCEKLTQREGHLGGPGSSLMSAEAVGLRAMVLACRRCGFLHWFLPSAREESLGLTGGDIQVVHKDEVPEEALSSEAESASAADRAPTPPPAPPRTEDACAFCGELLSADDDHCPRCGWRPA